MAPRPMLRPVVLALLLAVQCLAANRLAPHSFTHRWALLHRAATPRALLQRSGVLLPAIHPRSSTRPSAPLTALGAPMPDPPLPRTPPTPSALAPLPLVLGVLALGAAAVVSARRLRLPRPTTPLLALLAATGEKRTESLRTEAQRRFEQERPWSLFILFNLVTWGLILAASLPSSVSTAIRDGDFATATGNALFLILLGLLFQGRLVDRSRRLATIERELELGDMAVNRRDRLGNITTIALRDLRSSRRVALLYGPTDRLVNALQRAAVYRRRLVAAGIILVPVLQADTPEASEELQRQYPPGSATWLAQPVVNERWRAYFAQLLPADSPDSGAYITLGAAGRVRGSGVGLPCWDVLLSTFPATRPNEADDVAADLAVEDSGTAEQNNQAVLAVHRAFYAALLAGDEAAMASLWSSSADPELSRYSSKGARLDGWDTVLRPDRRPENMQTEDVDVWRGKGVAWVTAVERLGRGGTLLATHELRHTPKGWALVNHQTVPWGKDATAQLVLRCDHRGCIAMPTTAVTSTTTADAS